VSALGTPAGMALATDDGWAIFAQPAGLRDLGRPEYWSVSLERSLRRRAARRRPRIVAGPGAKVSIALAAAALGVPLGGGALGAQRAAAAVSVADLDLGSGDRGPQVEALQRALGISADGIFGPATERAVRAFQAGTSAR
jgi:hypothetical protein